MSSDIVLLLARLLMAALFLASGMPKLLGEPAEAKAIADLGFPAAGILLRLTGFGLVAGAAMLAFGAWTRVAAASLALFVVVVTPLFLRFWRVDDALQRVKLLQAFLGNVGITGGLLAFAATGPGGLALLPGS